MCISQEISMSTHWAAVWQNWFKQAVQVPVHSSLSLTITEPVGLSWKQTNNRETLKRTFSLLWAKEWRSLVALRWIKEFKLLNYKVILCWKNLTWAHFFLVLELSSAFFKFKDRLWVSFTHRLPKSNSLVKPTGGLTDASCWKLWLSLV